MKHRVLTFAVGVSAVVAFAAPPFSAQERIDADINAKIRAEGTKNSKILRTLHYLTDVYGPRLTGSPNLKAAGEWAIKEMASWGFENGRLEPWDFARPGWSNEVAIGAIVSPVKRQARVRSTGLDAEHAGHGQGQGLQPDHSRSADQRGSRKVSRRREEPGCEQHRARRTLAPRAGEPQPAGQAAGGRRGERTVQPAAERDGGRRRARRT